jgi:hypothetical protein
VKRKDEFGLCLAMFACAHFAFADNQGGLWSYVLCAVFIGVRMLGAPSGVRLTAIPKSAIVLLFFFLASQLVGAARNSYSRVSNIQVTVVAFSQVIVFLYCASQPMTAPRLRRLLAVWCCVACWVFVMALNQRYQWVIAESPLLPQRIMETGAAATTPAASFGTSELCAEYFSIVFVFLLVLLGHLKELAMLHITPFVPMLVFLLSAAGVTMGGSRAAALLAGLATGYLLLSSILSAFATRTPKKFVAYLRIALLAGVFVLLFQRYLFVESLVADFMKLDTSQLNPREIITGKGINRAAVFDAGYQRLRKQSWWIGYGYNLPQNNRVSVGIAAERFADYHNLYLSLPIYYGWVGSAAYVLLIVGAAGRAYRYYRKTRQLSHFLVPIALGLALLWAVFILDEFKISCTRRPCYFLLTWFWLGWSYSLATTLQSQDAHMMASGMRAGSRR